MFILKYFRILLVFNFPSMSLLPNWHIAMQGLIFFKRQFFPKIWWLRNSQLEFLSPQLYFILILLKTKILKLSRKCCKICQHEIFLRPKQQFSIRKRNLRNTHFNYSQELSDKHSHVQLRSRWRTGENSKDHKLLNSINFICLILQILTANDTNKNKLLALPQALPKLTVA